MDSKDNHKEKGKDSYRKQSSNPTPDDSSQPSIINSRKLDQMNDVIKHASPNWFTKMILKHFRVIFVLIILSYLVLMLIMAKFNLLKMNDLRHEDFYLRDYPESSKMQTFMKILNAKNFK